MEKTQGSLPPFWRWVKDADYAGKKTVKHKTYDLWVFHVSLSKLSSDPGQWSYHILCGIHRAVVFGYLPLLSLQAAGVRLEVGVLEDSPNTPYYFGRQESTQFIGIEFTVFNPATPPESVFAIPSQCKTGDKTPMTLLTRAETL